MTCAQGLLRLLWGGARSWSATALHQLHTNQIRSYFVCDAYNNYVAMQRMAAEVQ